MRQLLPSDIVEPLAREERHFAAAPKAFLQAWKRGVRLAGPQWFGDGTPEGLNQARDKWDLCPDVPRISKALSVLSGGERMFLAAMVSFYNERKGGTLLKRCGFHGLADFGGLDMERRGVLADLLLHYGGW